MPRRLIYAHQAIDNSVEMRAQFLLCKGFVNAGWDVELLTIAQAEPLHLSRAWGSAPIKIITGCSRIARLLKLSLSLLFRAPSSFVLTWVWDWHGYALALARVIFGSPYAVMLDGYPHRGDYHGTGFLTHARLELRYGLVLHNADVILAETPTAYQAATQHTKATVLLVSPGHWLEDLQATEQDWLSSGERSERTPTILYTGRLFEGKNIHIMIEAFSRLAGNFPEWAVEIVGPATEQAYALRLRRQVQELGLSDRVRFLPAMTGSELFRRYRMSSIYCFPSQSEGFPSAILEAMYWGGAIIASNVGNISYQLDGGRCGVLCPPGDLACLLDNLQRLMASSTDREGLIDAARQRCVEKFVWNVTFPRILYEFETALRGT